MAFSKEQSNKARAGVVIALLVVVAVLAAVVVSGAFNKTPGSSATAEQGSASASSNSESSSNSSSAQTDMDKVDAQYGSAAQKLKQQYEADSSTNNLINLANGYFDWGAAAQNAAETDADKSHVKELFTKAVEYYDKYLEADSSSKSAYVDRAISVYYTGDVNGAIGTLEEYTKGDGAGFAPAWANLGMFYEGLDRADDAKAAYEKAIETAGSDDAYGVKDYAEARLSALNG